MSFQEKYLSCHILLTDQISLSDFRCFLKYLAIYVLKLFAIQFVTSQTLKFVLVFLSSRFSTWKKVYNKNWNISRTSTAFSKEVQKPLVLVKDRILQKFYGSFFLSFKNQFPCFFSVFDSFILYPPSYIFSTFVTIKKIVLYFSANLWEELIIFTGFWNKLSKFWELSYRAVFRILTKNFYAAIVMLSNILSRKASSKTFDRFLNTHCQIS